jgi:hypothetical protein
MAITGASASYVSTTQQFLNHWQEVDATLAESPLRLEDGTTVALFEDVRGELLAMRDRVQDAVLERVLARATLNVKKEWLHKRVNLFKEKVIAALGSSVYARALPLIPGITEGQEAFSKPLILAAKLWKKIDAAPPAGFDEPLVLLDGTTEEAFATALAELAKLYEAVTDAEQDVTLALERRNDVQDRIYLMMKNYRLTVPTRIAAGTALLETLPALTPTSSRTPNPVVASGAVDAATQQAVISFTPSTDPDLEGYELRMTLGDTYDTEVDTAVATLAAGAVPQFLTPAGLPVPGSVATYKVYVKLKSGGEAGSNSVTLRRVG